MEGVFPGEEFPAPCSSIPLSDDGVSVPDEESSAPFDDVFPAGDGPRSHAVCPGFVQLVPQPM